ncbi:MAG: hypothetical protein M3Q07_05840, partial [Pseudobdellovibrionaceae bacterium]|nr:hypothetical protein [Pseudobdellovibrionaceae bacterium]
MMHWILRPTIALLAVPACRATDDFQPLQQADCSHVVFNVNARLPTYENSTCPFILVMSRSNGLTLSDAEGSYAVVMYNHTWWDLEDALVPTTDGYYASIDWNQGRFHPDPSDWRNYYEYYRFAFAAQIAGSGPPPPLVLRTMAENTLYSYRLPVDPVAAAPRFSYFYFTIKEPGSETWSVVIFLRLADASRYPDATDFLDASLTSAHELDESLLEDDLVVYKLIDIQDREVSVEEGADGHPIFRKVAVQVVPPFKA